MEIAQHVEFVASEGARLAAAAADAGFDTPVPGCPEWVVRDLVSHVGTVHRWAAAVVGEAMTSPKVEPPVVPADSELLDWYRAGHAGLIETLSNAPADLECFNFLPAPSPLAFWARRQALETAIHRADAEGAAGVSTPYDDALALDGLDELINGFGRRKKVFELATIRLVPAGAPEWLVALGPEGLVADSNPTAEDAAGADVAVSGSPSDVYRWTWNRPSDVTVTGAPELAAEWHKIAVRWS